MKQPPTRGSQRFDRRRRLGRARDYERVFERPHRSRDAIFTVLARRNALAVPRLGLAVARKHVPSAVGRNRTKRIIRESFRCHQDLISGLDVVVISRPGLRDAHPQALRTSLRRHWETLGERCRVP